MPKVGKKEFPYTKKGVAAAKKAAKKQGVKMVKKSGRGYQPVHKPCFTKQNQKPYYGGF